MNPILNKLAHDALNVLEDLIYFLYRAVVFVLISVVGGIIGGAIIVGLLRLFS